MERRDVFVEELAARMQGDEEDRTLVGYGAVFFNGSESTQYRLTDDIVERISPEAFERALREMDDVVGLFNHDPNLVLARVPETMRLKVDDRGLRYEMELGESQIADHVRKAVQRGDVRGSSFAFAIDGVEWKRTDDYDVRLITSVRLFDVGPVTYPAYKGTTADTRSLLQEREEALPSKPSYHYRRAIVEELLADERI